MTSSEKNKKAVKTGWAMLRVSTTGQAEVQHGSLEQQKNMVSRWAHQESERSGCLYKIVRFIEEDISGRGKYLHRRTELHELESAIDNSSIDFFVIEKVDRLTRDQIFNLQIVKKATKYNVEVHEYESGLIDLKDRGKRLGFNIKNMMAEEYSLELEEKVTKKLREAMLNNGKDASSMPVLGLDCHPTRACVYVVNKDEQKIVVDIFSKFIELGNLTALALYCAEQTYKTKIRITEKKIDKNGNIVPPRHLGGVPFESKSLRQLLDSHKLRGFSFFLDTWGQFPSMQDERGMVRWDYAHFKEYGPVVPLELWEQVQSIIDKKRFKRTKTKTGGEIYLLSGILQKSNGDFLVGASAKSGQNHYYEDRKAGEYRIIKNEIESAVCGRLSQYLKQDGLIESILKRSVNNKTDEVHTIENELLNVKRKLSGIQTALDSFSTYLRTAALESANKLDEVCKMINEERKKADDEKATLIKQLERLEAKKRLLTEHFEEKTIKKYLKLIFMDFEQKCSHQKKQIIQAVVPKIVVHPDDRLEIVLNPFFKGLGSDRLSGLDSGGPKFGCEKNGWGFATAPSR